MPTRGSLQDLAVPGLANPAAPTRTEVGEHAEFARKLGVRRGLTNIVNAAVNHPVTGIAATVNAALADPVTGVAAQINAALTNAATGVTARINAALADPLTGVAAQVAAAMQPIVLQLQMLIARSNNHQSISHGVGGLTPLADNAGNLPPPGLFPATVADLRSLRDASPAVRAPNHATLATLLSFYGVTDPLTNAIFPNPPGPLAAGAAGDAELQRMESHLETYLGRL
eukprot:TRINITY_DN12288_c0_g1_i1.p1 TRINITY_DN12288_c0_g1~~TRINITY_DN12288_c0_g1_i1.p1  ORF type:complete len:228 (+),score=3.74 TRINITY_DN12288_c0_g1_i1:200-883(+)